MRTVTRSALTFLLLATAALAAAPTTAPADASTTEIGTAAIPITITLPHAELLKAMKIAVGSPRPELVKAAVESALKAHAAAIKAKQPDFFTKDYAAHLDALTKSAGEELDKRFSDVEHVPPSLDKLATTFEDAVADDAPEMLITGHFVSPDPARSKALPAWVEPPDAKVQNWKPIPTTGDLDITLAAKLTVSGVTVPLSVHCAGKLSLKITEEIGFGANIVYPNRRTSPVSALPLVTVQIAATLDKDSILGDVDSIDYRFDLRRIKGRITAGESATTEP